MHKKKTTFKKNIFYKIIGITSISFLTPIAFASFKNNSNNLVNLNKLIKSNLSESQKALYTKTYKVNFNDINKAKNANASYAPGFFSQSHPNFSASYAPAYIHESPKINKVKANGFLKAYFKNGKFKPKKLLEQSLYIKENANNDNIKSFNFNGKKYDIKPSSPTSHIGKFLPGSSIFRTLEKDFEKPDTKFYQIKFNDKNAIKYEIVKWKDEFWNNVLDISKIYFDNPPLNADEKNNMVNEIKSVFDSNADDTHAKILEVTIKDPIDGDSKESEAIIKIELEGEEKEFKSKIEYANSKNDIEKKIELNKINSDFAEINKKIELNISSNIENTSSVKDVLKKGLDKDKLQILVNSVLSNYHGYEIKSASYNDTWSNQWGEKSAKLKYKLKISSLHNGEIISPEYYATRNFSKSSFEKTLLEYDGFRFDSLTTVDLNDKDADSESEIPLNESLINPKYIKSVLGKGPYDVEGISISNINYTKPNNETKSAEVQFDIEANNEKQHFKFTLNWKKSFNAQVIDDYDENNLVTKFSLKESPVSTADGLNIDNYILNNNNNNIKITNISGYSFDGDQTTNFSVDVTIKLGSKTRVITKKLDFSKKLVDSNVKNALDIISDNESNDDIEILGTNANEFTLKMPAVLSKTTLEKDGLKLLIKIGDSSFEDAYSYNGQSSNDKIEFKNWNNDVIKKFPSIHFKVSLIDPTDATKHLSSSLSSRIETLKSNAISSKKIYIDTSSNDLNSLKVIGTTNNFTINGDVEITDGSQVGAHTLYTLSEWAAPSRELLAMGVKTQMTKDELEKIFDGSNENNLWDINNTTLATLKAKLVSYNNSYVISNDNETEISLDDLKTYVEISKIKSDITNDLKIMQGGDSGEFTWNSKLDTIQNYLDKRGMKLEFSKDESSWSTIAPTSTDFDNISRKAYIRIVPKSLTNNYISSDKSSLDILTSSTIDKLKGYVDTSTAPDLSLISLMGNTNKLIWKNVEKAPKGSNIMFSLNVGGNDSGWQNKSSFEKWIKDNASKLDITKIKAKYVVTDNSLYIVRDGEEKEETITTKNFFNYVDVSEIISKIDDITYSGVLDKPKHLLYSLPSELIDSTLTTANLKLQYWTYDSNATETWKDVKSSLIDEDLQNNISQANNGELITIIKNSDGSANIKWRIVPIVGYQTGHDTKSSTATTYEEFVNATKVVLSDYISSGENVSGVAIDKTGELSDLPTLVTTKVDKLGDISISGNSSQIDFDEKIDDKTPKLYLESINENKPDYSSSVILVYSVNIDGQIIWMKKDDFKSWMSGSANTTTQVWYGSSKNSSSLKTSDVIPKWNKVDISSFQVKWTSIDKKLFITNGTPVNIAIDSSFKKFIVVDTWLQKLKKMFINGDTQHLEDKNGSIDLILNELQSSVDANKGDFEIEATYLNDSSSKPDWTKAVSISSSIDFNKLVKINFDKELFFRIVNKNEPSKYLIRTNSDKSATEVPFSTWDGNSKDSIKRWVNLMKNKIEDSVVLDGNTRNISEKISSSFTHFDINGEHTETKENEGIDVWYSLANNIDKNINSGKMPFKIFQAYLAGTLSLNANVLKINGSDFNDYPGNLFGFTSSNINPPKFDGKWGREKISLYLVPNKGYEFDDEIKAEIPLTNTSKIISHIKRYVKIDEFIKSLQTGSKKIQVLGDGINKWWNYKTGTFDNSKDNEDNDFGTYIDSKNLNWSTFTIPKEYKIKIQYSIDNGSKWVDTLPTETTDSKVSRKLLFKIIPDGKYDSGEEIDYSLLNKKNKDITSTSRINIVTTNIALDSTMDLSDIEIKGSLNWNGKNVSITDISVPTNSEIVYTLTDFTDLNETKNSTNILLDAMQLSHDASSISKLESAGFKPSMTKQEFLDFLNSVYKNYIATGFKEDSSGNKMIGIYRKLIKARIRAKKGYSIKNEEITKTVAEPKTNDLYTYRDVKNFIDKMILKDDTDPESGIHLQGKKTLIDGVAVFLPSTLVPDNLSNYGLKLQWTISSPDGQSIAPKPTWNDVAITSINKSEKSGITWDSSTAKGFKVTLTPKNGNNAYLALRLIPIVDENGDKVKSISDPNSDIKVYFDETKTTLYNGIKEINNGYNIDTSKIPTVVKTETLQGNLDKITFTGNTHNITIHEDRDKIDEWIDQDNPEDKTLKSNINVFYSIDKNSKGDIIWLIKDDFEAYLNGDLSNINNKITNSKTNQIVSALSIDLKTKPNYNKLNLDDIKIKLSGGKDSHGKSYIPSTVVPVKGSFTIMSEGENNDNSLQKWIDVTSVLNKLKVMKIMNDTNDPLDEHGKKDEFITKLLNELFSDVNTFGTGNNTFEVQVTFDFDDDGPKFDNSAKVSINELKHLDFTKRLAFRFKKAGSEKFFISTSASPDKEKPMIIWDNSTSKDALLKFVHVKNDDLSKVTLTGNTNVLNETNDDQFKSIIKSDVDGKPITAGSYEGIDVWYSLEKIDGQETLNYNKMPFEVFKAYLEGKLTLSGNILKINGSDFNDYPGNSFGFTSSNVNPPKFDGKWGREKIRLSLHAKKGYKITDLAKDVYKPAEDSSIIESVKRFIDITIFVNGLKDPRGANSIRVNAKNLPSADFWWNYDKGIFDSKKDNSGTDFGSYIDSKNIKWDKIIIPRDYKIKMQYSVDGGSSWKDELPTKTIDEKSNRKLDFRLVSSGKYDSGELAEFSIENGKIFDVTTSSRLNKVPTNVYINSTKLPTSDLKGNLNYLLNSGKDLSSFNITEKEVPENTKLVYSLTNFTNLYIKPGGNGFTEELLNKIGMPISPDSIIKLKSHGYKAAMTSAEFRIFLNNVYKIEIKHGYNEKNLTNKMIGINRGLISIRLRAENGYSITKPDLEKTTNKPNTDDLYTYRDISIFTSKLKLSEDTDHNSGIHIQGRKTVKDGAAIFLPDILTPSNLEIYGLKIQWTTTSADGLAIGLKPVWNYVDVSKTIDSDKSSGIKWDSSTAKGFKVTLTPKAGNNAFLALRVIPYKNEDGIEKTPLGKDENIDAYFNTSKTILFDGKNKVNNNYNIDTSKIPTVVTTEELQKHLKEIEFIGNTHNITINEDRSKINDWIDGDNSADPTLKNYIEVRYSIDKNPDGTKIWLPKKSFEAYLNGGLILSNGKVIFKSGGKEIDELSQIKRASPDYNKLDLNNISVKLFGGKDAQDKSYTPSTDTEVSGLYNEWSSGKDETNSLKKWIDVTDVLKNLQKMEIKNNTFEPKDKYDEKGKYIQEIIGKLFDDVNIYGGDNTFEVQVTFDFDDDGPKFDNSAKVSINELKHLDFTKRLAFRFKKAGSEKFFISTSASPDKEKPMIIWDNSTSKDALLKFVHVKNDDLSKVTLTGNTNVLNETNDDQFKSIIKSDVDGKPITAGSYEGIDVWYSLEKIDGQETLNYNKMPFEVFKAYLEGKLTLSGNILKINGSDFNDYPGNSFGFTSSNVNPPKFDGKWGREKIRLSLKARNGFVLDFDESDKKYTPDPTTSSVVSGINRFINIDQFIAELQDDSKPNHIRVFTNDKSNDSFWWNYDKGTFDSKKDNSGNTFGSYVDSKNLVWGDTKVPNEYKIKIQYSVDGSIWTDQPPTTTIDNKGNRKLLFKIISDGTYGNGSIAEFSTENRGEFNVVSTSKLDVVSTNVAKSTTDLSQIDISGVLNWHQKQGDNKLSDFDIAEVEIPDHAKIVYTLSKFTNLDASKDDVIKLFTSLGMPANDASISTLKGYGYKAEMTSSEFRDFIDKLYTNVIKKGYKKESDGTVILTGLPLSNIETRLKADIGYSITQSDLESLRKKPKTNSLYGYRDISEFSSLVGDINLFGQKTTKNGVVVVLPNNLNSNNLKKYGLKMQWTTNSKENPSADGVIISDTPKWMDVLTTSLPKGQVTGSPETDNGFTITITPQKNNDALLSFRFVPISGIESTDGITDDSDLESDKSTMSDIQGKFAKWTMKEYFESTRMKLYDTGMDSNTLIDSKYNGYRVDTNSIPTVIKTNKDFLKTIEFTGDTNHIKIHEDTNGSEKDGEDISSLVDGINSDQTLSTHLDIMYAIDKLDGKPLTNKPSHDDKSVLWLTKEDFVAYMNHNDDNHTLRIDSTSKKVYNISTSKEISALSDILSKNGRFRPMFRTLNIDHIYSKFIANDFKKSDGKIQTFIPEDPDVMKVTVTKGKDESKSFRKWLSGKTILDEIKGTIIRGTTQSTSTWDLSRDNSDPSHELLKYISDSALKLMNLKLEFSFDGENWHDRDNQLYDTYELIKNRHMFMRVIPDSTPNHTVDEINIDFDGFNSYAEAKINATDDKGEKFFKMYIDLNSNLLSQVVFKGNTYKLQNNFGIENEGLLEKINAGANGVDPNDYVSGHDIEIQYLYKGNWYNKSELLKEMNKLRSEPKDKNLKLPTDFTHDKVQARWWIIDKNEAVVVDEEKDTTSGNFTGASPSHDVTSDDLLTFVNIWDVQNSQTTNSNFVFTDGQNQGKNNPYFSLLGSVNSIKLKWTDSMKKWFTEHHMRVEWSISENPADKLFSSKWQSASDTNYKDLITTKDDPNNIVNIALNPVHKSLWIRFVPEDQTSTKNSEKWFASSRTIAPKDEQKIIAIGIDTNNLTFEVDVSNDALKTIKFITNNNENSPIDTQGLFNADLGNYLETNFDGITPKTVNEKGELEELDKTDESNIKQWLSDVGLSVFFRIKQTRTEKNDNDLIGKKDEDGYIVYETLDDLKKDLSAKKINFDRSSLQIKYGILKDKSTKYSVSDTSWVTPTDVSKIVNVVYTEDIYMLNNKSFILGGNTIVANAKLNGIKGIEKYDDPEKIAKDALAKLGLKIMWTTSSSDGKSIDPNPSWKDDIEANFHELPQHKGVWIKYVPIDINYKVDTDAISDKEQLMKLDADVIKIAIVLDENFMSKFNTMKIDPKSTTLKPTMIGQPELKPTTITKDEFKYLYSLGTNNSKGDIIWENSIGSNDSNDHGILLDSYGIDRFSLDKDREKSFQIKMFINKTDEYVFTNKAGTKYDDKDLLKDIPIDKIQQPVYIKDNLKQIASKKDTLKLPSLPSGINTWEEFANNPKFLPDFLKGSSSTKADLLSFSYDGKNLKDDKKSDFFGWGMNPFDENDNITRDIMTSALVPRHTHFKFIIKKEDDKDFVDETKDKPEEDLPTSTQTKTLRVILVADEGYYLPKEQSWKRDFNVVLVSTTTNMAISSIIDTDKAIKFIGFETPEGVSKPALYDPLNPNDPNKGNPNLKFVTYIDDGDGGLKPTELPLYDLFKNESFSLEWNVLGKDGREIIWTDQKGTKALGWHEFPKPPDPQNDKSGYDSNGGQYGRYPVSLKNGNKVLIRFRANNGWVIRDRNNLELSAKIPNTDNYLKYSHVLTYDFKTLNKSKPSVIDDAIVKKLPKKINIPDDYGFEPTGWMKDRKGESISVKNDNNPKVTFKNADGFGEIVINFGNPSDLDRKNIKNETKVLTQILRPWIPLDVDKESVEIINFRTLRPSYGYEMLFIDSEGKKEWKLVAVTKKGYNGLTKEMLDEFNDSKNATKDNGRIIWVKNSDTLKNSWIDVEKVNFLKSAWALRFKLAIKEKSDYAFEWEGKRGEWEGIVDSWIPKNDTRQLFNKNDDYDKTQVDASYYTITVTGLLIKPQWEPTDPSLELKYLPVDGLTSPYQNNAIVQMNKMPVASDLWKWEYSIDGGKTWVSNIPKTVGNGIKILLRATPKGNKTDDPFKFDGSYDNTEKEFIISGLKDMISTAAIPRPILTIGGFQGKGHLTAIEPHITPDRNTPYLKTGSTYNGVLVPDVVAGADSAKSKGGLKWQFQVSHVNPDGISKDKIEALEWTDEPPSNLIVGDFVRAKLTSKDPKEKVEPTIYSYTEVPKTDKKGNVVISGGSPVMIEGNKNGWQRVDQMSINAKNIDIKVSVQGYIKDTFLSYKLLQNSPDELGIKIEASYMNKNEWHDLTFFDKLENFITNKSIGLLEFRAVAKNGFSIPTGPDYNDSEEYNPTDTLEQVYFSDESKTKYIQLPSWKNYKVEKLLEYIDVRKISFKPVQIVRDLAHPKMDNPEMKEQFPDFKPEDVLSDYAMVIPKGAVGEVKNGLKEWLEKVNSIKDKNGISALDKVKIVFIVSKFDPFSGAFTQLPQTETLPKGLSNMDQLKIKVIPIDSKVYKLSSDNLELNVGIRDLVQLSPKLDKKPTMIFRGDDGGGTVSITPAPPKGYIWEYQIKDGKSSKISEFSDNPPLTLKNGDEVKVRIRSAIPGVKIGNNYETDFYQVTGLLTKIDLSEFTLNSVDKILKIVGKKENTAYISGKNPVEMKDAISLENIPFKDKLEWRYYVTDDVDDIPNESARYTETRPAMLKNGQYVRAILVSKDQKYDVYGFNPISIKVTGLVASASVSNRLILVFLGVGAGVLILSGTTIFIFIVRRKKLRNM